MREIIFRGKSLVTKEWVFGDLFQHGEQRFIMTGGHNIEVDPESVGEFTGLTDKNGVKIFEGDIIKSSLAGLNYEVFWDGAFAAYTMIDTRDRYGFPRYGLSRYGARTYEVISNIHDNLELIEDDDDDE